MLCKQKNIMIEKYIYILLCLFYFIGNYSSVTVCSECTLNETSAHEFFSGNFKELIEEVSKSFSLIEQPAEGIAVQERITLALNHLFDQTNSLVESSNKALLQQLNILIGHVQHPESSLLKQLTNNNVSVFELLRLVHVLAHPLTDVEQLQKRQAGIKTLCNDPVLLQKWNIYFDALCKGQDSLLKYFKQEDEVVKIQWQKNYFKWSIFTFLNRYEPVLFYRFTGLQEAFHSFNKVCFIIGLSSLSYIFRARFIKDKDILPIMNAFCDLQVEVPTNNNVQAKISLKELFKNLGTLLSKKWIFSLDGLRNLLNIDPIYGVCNAAYILSNKSQEITSTLSRPSFFFNAEQKKQIEALQDNLVSKCMQAPFNLFNLFTCINGIRNALEKNKSLIKPAYNDLCYLSEVISMHDELKKIISSRPELQQALATFDCSQDVPDRSVSDQFQELVEMLREGSFKKDASLVTTFFQAGKVLKARVLLQVCKHEFAPMINFIAKVGVLRTAANVYLTHQEGSAKVCFPEYAEQQASLIDAQNMWNIALKKEKAIPNSIVLGGKENPRGLIITGSNTGGKSTLQKALLHQAFFAQTLCIAPSERVKLTPFHIIGALMSVTDDVTRGASLYQAEINGLRQFYKWKEHVKKENQKALLVADEPFKGTGADNGSELFMNYVKRLLDLDQKDTEQEGFHAIVCFSTHLRKATELAKLHSTVIMNGCVDVEKQSDGTYAHTYKLQKNKVSEVNIAEDIAREIYH